MFMILIDFMDGMFTIPSQWLPHCIVNYPRSKVWLPNLPRCEMATSDKLKLLRPMLAAKARLNNSTDASQNICLSEKNRGWKYGIYHDIPWYTKKIKGKWWENDENPCVNIEYNIYKYILYIA